MTLETNRYSDSQRIRIPDVCGHFGVRCINTSDMLEELNFSATARVD